MEYTRVKKIFIPFLALSLGYVAGFWQFGLKTGQLGDSLPYKIHPANAHFEYIKPLLAYDSINQTRQPKYLAIDDALSNIIKDSIRAGRANLISVYYRDLNTNRWIGINEHERLNPASLLKIPVMMAVLKRGQDDPAFLKKEVTISSTQIRQNIQPSFQPQQTVEAGKNYTVEKLLEYMIVYSDNVATAALESLMDDASLNEVLTDLGIQLPTSPDENFVISTKTYSLFFRILFNATYLSQGSSEKAMELLVRSDHASGLRAGVPKDIPVAEKFGEYGVQGGNLRIQELHDCGIVYHPVNPYLLCIMTRGKQIDSLSDAITTLSKTTYEMVGTLPPPPQPDI